MKSFKVISILACVLFLTNAFAQKPYQLKKVADEPQPTQTYNTPEPKPDYGPPKLNVIKLNMLSPVYSSLMFFFERSINKENSLELGLGYMNFDGFSNSSTLSRHTEAFFITPEYRYMLKGENLNGTYIEPFLKFTSMNYTESGVNYIYNSTYPYNSIPAYYNDSYSYQSLGIGICLGQQYIYKNKISIDFFAGPVFNMLLSKSGPSGNNVTIDQSLNTTLIKGYSLRGGLTVGFLY